MPKFKATPPDVTPVTKGSWTDVDVSTHVDAGSTSWVALRIHNGNASSATAGVRKNGSTDTLTFTLNADEQIVVGIGVDASDIFEANVAAGVTIELLMYALTSEGGHVTNAVDVTPGTINAWQDVDIATETGGDTATMAGVLVHNPLAGTDRGWKLRPNGSTDDFTLGAIYRLRVQGGFVSCDGSEVFEAYLNHASLNLLLTVWLTANYTTLFTNRKSYATGTTGSYVDADMSADVPSGAAGVLAAVMTTATFNARQVALRRDGATHDPYADVRTTFQGIPVECSTARVIEQKIENTNKDLYLEGWFAAPAASGAEIQPPGAGFGFASVAPAVAGGAAVAPPGAAFVLAAFSPTIGADVVQAQIPPFAGLVGNPGRLLKR